MAGLCKKGTFGDKDLPQGRKAIKTRSFLKIKRSVDGTMECYKAQLMARNFTQNASVNFFETFSPVVGYNTLRGVMSVAAYRGWGINALDFTQAYLNADLQEDIWLKLPDGCTAKAEKAIYGLKQSAMGWYHELRSTILAEGWTSSQYDKCLYFRKSEDRCIAILTTYMDDTATTGDFMEEIQRMRALLREKYEWRNLGTPDKLIGVGITVGADSITLDQQLYAESIVMAGMGSTEVWDTSTPFNSGMDLSARHDNEEELNSTIFPYASILGQLMFLVDMTRPDLANSIHELGCRAASPCMRHWRGLQHVLCYVAETLDACIHYGWGSKDMNGGDRKLLVGYGDSDWGTDSQTCRSVTGYPYYLLINGSPIAWCSKLQGAVTLSSLEAEWMTTAYGMRHYIFVRGILGEIGVLQDQTPWFCDNRGAIQAGSITGFNGRTKHVDMKLKSIRENMDQGLFHVEYIPASKQLGDILTKSLCKSLTSDFVHSVLSRRG
ncbi:unnamed protein product [Choristocarpus tenellus]